VRIAVADSGVGVPPDKLSTLFSKFTQVDASITRRHGGTGLGLAICRELAELMGGRIEAESVVGRGSTFTLTLPLARAEQAVVAATPARSSAPVVHGLRVLAAEDNAVNQLVLKALLSPLAVDLTVVNNGAEALAAWAEGEWSVILMDVQMPVMDGVSAAREIRRCEAALGRARTPIIALTANALAHQTLAYQAAGMDGHISKPIEISELLAAIDQALRAAEGEAEVLSIFGT
jgi:CheY-like chemotaxis protein